MNDSVTPLPIHQPQPVNDVPEHLRGAIARAQARAQPQEVQPPKVDVSPEPLAEIPKFETHHIFKLSRPVERHGSQVMEVTLRVPVALDLFEIGGLPTKTAWQPQGMTVEMDIERLKKWIQRLSDIDSALMFQMPARDLRTIYEWLNTELSGAGN